MFPTLHRFLPNIDHFIGDNSKYSERSLFSLRPRLLKIYLRKTIAEIQSVTIEIDRAVKNIHRDVVVTTDDIVDIQLYKLVALS